jgi:hypothetical protein
VVPVPVPGVRAGLDRGRLKQARAASRARCLLSCSPEAPEPRLTRTFPFTPPLGPPPVAPRTTRSRGGAPAARSGRRRVSFLSRRKHLVSCLVHLDRINCASAAVPKPSVNVAPMHCARTCHRVTTLEATFSSPPRNPARAAMPARSESSIRAPADPSRKRWIRADAPRQGGDRAEGRGSSGCRCRPRPTGRPPPPPQAEGRAPPRGAAPPPPRRSVLAVASDGLPVQAGELVPAERPGGRLATAFRIEQVPPAARREGRRPRS